MKVETVTEYIANDGTRFRDEVACEDYDRESLLVRSILGGLARPSGHGTFIQSTSSALRAIKKQLWVLVLAKYGKLWPEWTKWDSDDVRPFSIVGRVLDDCERGPLGQAWAFLGCMDFERGRIYDQPYYVSHPEETVRAKP